MLLEMLVKAHEMPFVQLKVGKHTHQQIIFNNTDGLPVGALNALDVMNGFACFLPMKN